MYIKACIRVKIGNLSEPLSLLIWYKLPIITRVYYPCRVSIDIRGFYRILVWSVTGFVPCKNLD